MHVLLSRGRTCTTDLLSRRIYLVYYISQPVCARFSAGSNSDHPCTKSLCFCHLVIVMKTSILEQQQLKWDLHYFLMQSPFSVCFD